MLLRYVRCECCSYVEVRSLNHWTLAKKYNSNPKCKKKFLKVYKRTCAQLVRAVLDGYNACCFAYGATGGGKTHTMVGTHEDPGCMVQALNELFREMDENTDFTFRVSKQALAPLGNHEEVIYQSVNPVYAAH